MSTSEKGVRESEGSSSRWGLVYRSKEVWLVGLFTSRTASYIIIYVTFFSAYLETTFNWSKEVAGGLWSLVRLLSIVSGILWGWASDVLGRRYGMALAYSVLALSYLLYALALLPLQALRFSRRFWPHVVKHTHGGYSDRG
jgi:nitrate/nitrite transporter NarK